MQYIASKTLISFELYLSQAFIKFNRSPQNCECYGCSEIFPPGNSSYE